MIVACAADRRYALPLAVTLRSALANLDPERRLEAYVVDGGIEEAARERVTRSLTDRAIVHWVPPLRASFSGVPLWGGMPLTTYDKMMIARILPATVSKAVWLDCDVLVLGDVARLYDLDVTERHLLAAQDTLVPCVSSRFGVAGYEDLGIGPDAGYFNVGVMVVNLGAWRRDDVAARGLDYLRRYRDRVFFMDQEALNAVLAGKWGALDPRWNWSATRDRLNGGLSTEPWILHFSGHLKPWMYRGTSAHHTLYFRYLDMTAWGGWRPRRDWRSRVLGLYESSRLRRVLYPVEQLGTRLVRRMTRRAAAAIDD